MDFVNYFINKYPYTDFHELNLDWILSIIKEMDVNTDDCQSQLDQLKANDELVMTLYNEIMAGDFPESLKTAFSNWMKNNAIDLVGELIHNVWFGLTGDGYFVAFIPESWEDIQFGTSGLDDFPEGISYGHLTLSY